MEDCDVTQNRENNEHEYVYEADAISLTIAQIGINKPSTYLINVGRRLENLWERSESDAEKMRCIDLAAELAVAHLDFWLVGFSMEMYLKGNHKLAFYGFTKGAGAGSIRAKNNLAYMVRRGECNCGGSNRVVVAVNLLLPGLQERDPFSIINTAMVFGLLLGEENDWHIVDKLVGFLKTSDRAELDEIAEWWDKLDDEIERYLVQFLFLRHGIIESSRLGTTEGLYRHLTERMEGFPEWLGMPAL